MMLADGRQSDVCHQEPNEEQGAFLHDYSKGNLNKQIRAAFWRRKTIFAKQHEK